MHFHLFPVTPGLVPGVHRSANSKGLGDASSDARRSFAAPPVRAERSTRPFLRRTTIDPRNKSGRDGKISKKARYASSFTPFAARSSAWNSSSFSVMFTAAVFSSRCATLPVPGIGSMTGLRFNTQASAIWLGAAL